jgi:hypothetical protein
LPSPFPGMDPYLEDPRIWRGFHHYLADEIVRRLSRDLGSKYYADVEVEVAIEGVNVSQVTAVYADAAVLDRSRDVPGGEPTSRTAVAIPEAPVHRALRLSEEIKLRSVRVVQAGSGDLVTSIEILSPFNKRGGGPTEMYLKKRNRILLSPVHLIEVDLLRGGERPGPEVREPPLDADYVVLVNRANGPDFRTSEIWPLALTQPLPVIPVPLLPPDPDVALDLAGIVRSIYESYGYERRLDYSREVPLPGLRPEIRRWFEERHPGIGG